MPNGTLTSTGEVVEEAKKAAPAFLKDGCYLIRYTPVEPSPDILFYEGTFRVLHVGPDGKPKADGEARAGGDLYCRLREFRYGRDLSQWPKEAGSPDPARWPNPNVVPVLLDDAKTGVIPVFPRQDYRFYLEVIKILEHVPTEGIVTVRFNVHTFDQNQNWPNPGTRSVALAQTDPSTTGVNYPKEPESKKPIHFAGNLIDEDSGQIVGAITLGWISRSLRRATVEIDHVKGVDPPGIAKEWRNVFDTVPWELAVIINKPPIPEPPDSGGVWTTGALHEALFKLRVLRTTDEAVIKQAMDRLAGRTVQEMSLAEIRDYILARPAQLDLLDRDWYYHLLCVRRIEGFDRGVMFDTYGADSDNVPREGAAIAAQWDFREQDKKLEERWSNVKAGELQQAKNVYFRVAVHEIGHAMGLDHNHRDNGFMNTTDALADTGLVDQKKAAEARVAADMARLQADIIAGQAGAAVGGTAPVTPAASYQAKQLLEAASKRAESLEAAAKLLEKKKPFPQNIEQRFHPDDLSRLRFGPDVTVRPGTTFEDYGPLFGDDKLTPAEGIELQVSPLLESVPIGAPVRIQMTLKNVTEKDQRVPRSLSLKAGVLEGRVFDPDGNERTYWPLKKCVDGDQYAVLAPNATSSHSTTLLRGAQKALFPMAGDHRVMVSATWEGAEGKVFAEGETTVHVTPPVDESHRAAALKIISTPDTLLSLAIGGDYLMEGNAAIKAALGNPILKPHLAVIEAKVLLARSPDGKYLDRDGKEVPDSVGKAKTRLHAACELIDDSTVLSFDEIERLYELIDKPNVLKAAKPKSEPRRALGSLIEVLLGKIGKLLLQGAADAERAKTLKENLSKLREGLP